jgi:hypothetical protein
MRSIFSTFPLRRCVNLYPRYPMWNLVHLSFPQTFSKIFTGALILNPLPVLNTRLISPKYSLWRCDNQWIWMSLVDLQRSQDISVPVGIFGTVACITIYMFTQQRRHFYCSRSMITLNAIKKKYDAKTYLFSFIFPTSNMIPDSTNTLKNPVYMHICKSE